jgi:hypothetical protein
VYFSLAVDGGGVLEAASYRLCIDEEEGSRMHDEDSPRVKIGSRGFGGEIWDAREGELETNIVVMKLVMFSLPASSYRELVPSVSLRNAEK